MLDPSRPWWDVPLVVFDLETTGVIPTTAEPVSVAAVRLERGEETAHLYALVDPCVPIPPAASAIHGITDAMVAGRPQLAALAPDLAVLADGALPVGYNGELYDKIILHRHIQGLSDDTPPIFHPAQRWVDVLVMIRKIDRFVKGGGKGSGRHRLANACKRWGVPFGEGEGQEAHNALADVRATGRLLVALVKAGRVNPRTSVAKMLEYTGIVRAEEEERFAAYQERVKAREAQGALALDEGEPGRPAGVP